MLRQGKICSSRAYRQTMTAFYTRGLEISVIERTKGKEKGGRAQRPGECCLVSFVAEIAEGVGYCCARAMLEYAEAPATLVARTR
jgi:hypothetical protein